MAKSGHPVDDLKSVKAEVLVKHNERLPAGEEPVVPGGFRISFWCFFPV
jgi:hypothetical protein